MKILIIGAIILLFLVLSSRICSLFGQKIRHFYFFLGLFFGFSANFSLLYIGIAVFLGIISFWNYTIAQKDLRDFENHPVVESFSLSMSGYGFGFLVGVISSIIKFYFF